MADRCGDFIVPWGAIGIGEQEMVEEVDREVSSADQLFMMSLEWMRRGYARFEFVAERDVVWSLQKWLSDQIVVAGLPFRVFSDEPLLKGTRRARSVDLAIVDGKDRQLLSAEFKYEPCHSRSDIRSAKLPVIGWVDVLKDIEKLKEATRNGRVNVGYSICIDEGGFFRSRSAYPDGKWLDWHTLDTMPFRTSIHLWRIGISEAQAANSA